MSPDTESVASRIDVDSKAQLELAVEESDTSMSAYLESVIEEHIDRNPRDLRAFESSTTQDPDEAIHTTREERLDGFIEEMFEGLE